MKRVSVIIPVYNVENSLIKKCFESICKQTYKDLEIILVDDATNDSNKELILECCEKDERAKCVVHEKNKGLFLARITGVKYATGDYIAFVDADDFIAVDWIRALVDKIGDADIVLGKHVNIDSSGYKYIYNLCDNYTTNKSDIENPIEYFMENECEIYSIHTMWNKLYTKALWDNCLQYLEKNNDHLIMTEDIAFTTVLFGEAKKLAFSNEYGYFYYRQENSSTLDVNGFPKAKKNAHDLICSFSFIEHYLKEKGMYEKYKVHFKMVKDRYFRYWSQVVWDNTNDIEIEKKEVRDNFFKYFEKSTVEPCIETDTFFASETTQWNDKYETLKEMIISDDIQIVSFDIFDTLVERNVLQPDHIFDLIEQENEFAKSIEFKKIRINAENETRRELKMGLEDISLGEIYDHLEKKLNIKHDKLEELKQLEKSFELRSLYPRELGKNLFELALFMNKRVVLTSDMYFDEDIVKSILDKCGYQGYECIFLSSKEKKLKATGNLFKCLIEKVEVDPGKIIHIGDNYNADFLVAKQLGIKANWIPKSSDICFNRVSDYDTGKFVAKTHDNSNSIIDCGAQHLNQVQVAQLYQVISMMNYSSNPFVSFKSDSDYNINPYLLGNSAIGMHVFGIVSWLKRISCQKKYNKILFTSRDGYCIYNAYNYIRQKVWTELPQAEYIYVSRRSVIAMDFITEDDYWKLLKCDSWSNYSPETIIVKYDCIFKDINYLEMNKNHFDFGKTFDSYESYVNFIIWMKQFYSIEKANETRNLISGYFKSRVSAGDAIFDMGYSAKIHKSIVMALGFAVDALFVNSSGVDSEIRARDYKFEINTYYDYTPSMAGAISEYLLSELAPSCIGYCKEGEQYNPIYDDAFNCDYSEKYVVGEIQRGCFDFIKKVIEYFDKKELDNISLIRSTDFSMSFEKMLMNVSAADLKMFNACMIEDMHNSGRYAISMREVYEWQKRDRNIEYHVNTGFIVDDRSAYELSEIRKSKAYKLALKISLIARKLHLYKG